MEQKISNLARIGSGDFAVYLDQVKLRDNSKSKRIRIQHPGASAIVPFISDSEILLVKQFRYALQKQTLEIPAGKLDPNEAPETCASRELLEETGYRAGKIEYICRYFPAVGYSNEIIYIFSARNLQKVDQHIDEREIASVEIFSVKDIEKMIKEEKIIDGKTLLSLSILNLLAPAHK